MDIQALADSPVGFLVPITGTDPRTGVPYEHHAFVPHPLPDSVQLSSQTWNRVSEAMEALGRLRQAVNLLPNPSLLIVPALAREAVSTSALEGTYAALPDVLEARLPQLSPRSREVQEVRGYELMAERAFQWVRERPITLSMLTDLQALLVEHTRQPSRDPGRIREHQVLIGAPDCSIAEARFIPPPPNDQLRAGLEAWQDWIAADHEMPIVVRVALAHYQFETLHPFGDGNGRVGRLVILLQLLREAAVSEPALTISPWFERHREEYMNHLLRISRTGEWDPWVSFVASAFKEQCEAHVAVIDHLLQWIQQVRAEIHSRNWSGMIVALADDLIDWPVITIGFAAEQYGVSFVTAKHAVDRLVEIGVLSELTGRTYGRVFGATEVMQAVDRL